VNGGPPAAGRKKSFSSLAVDIRRKIGYIFTWRLALANKFAAVIIA
jgi:hypothetical protein